MCLRSENASVYMPDTSFLFINIWGHVCAYDIALTKASYHVLVCLAKPSTWHSIWGHNESNFDRVHFNQNIIWIYDIWKKPSQKSTSKVKRKECAQQLENSSSNCLPEGCGFVLSYCLVYSLQPYCHLLEKDWPLDYLVHVYDVFLWFCHFPIWCPDQVWDLISLPFSLLLLRFRIHRIYKVKKKAKIKPYW